MTGGVRDSTVWMIPKTSEGRSGHVEEPVGRWDEFNAMYEQSFGPVQGFVHSRVRDPVAADDLVADIFERALRNWHTFEGRSTGHAWVLGIARHIIADYRRQASTRREMCVDGILERDGAAIAPSLEDVVERRESVAHLRLAIEGLSDQDQDLLALRYVAELPLRELAVSMGVREVTVRVRLHRTLGRLRAKLREQGYER